MASMHSSTSFLPVGGSTLGGGRGSPHFYWLFLFEVYFRSLGDDAAARFQWRCTVHVVASRSVLHCCVKLRRSTINVY